MRESYDKYMKRRLADLRKISHHHVWEKLTVRQLNLSRGTIQQAYKDMADGSFDGDVIDYICHSAMCDFMADAYIAYDTFKSIKKTIQYLDMHLDIHNEILVPMCRLFLKNEKYLAEAFNVVTINQDHELFIESRKLLIKKANVLLKY
jgi:hypothetical protein